MPEVRYNYGPADNAAGYDEKQLSSEVTAAGLPAHNVYGSGYAQPGDLTCPDVQVGFAAALTGAQKTTLDGVITAHVPNPGNKDARRRDTALAMYDDPDAPASLVELSGEYAILALVNELQRAAGISETGKAQLRNQVRAIIKPGGTP